MATTTTQTTTATVRVAGLTSPHSYDATIDRLEFGDGRSALASIVLDPLPGLTPPGTIVATAEGDHWRVVDCSTGNLIAVLEG